MATLDDFMKQLNNPAPVFEDDEDVGDGTTAGSNWLTEREKEGEEGGKKEVTSQRSRLRQKAADFFDWSDKYSGKKVSRSDLAEEDDLVKDENDKEDSNQDEDDSEEEELEEDAVMDEGESDDEEEDAIDDTINKEVPSDDDEVQSDDEEIQSDDDEENEALSGDEDDDDDDGDDDEVDDDESSGANDVNNSELTRGATQDDAEKACAVVHQLDLWDRILETRIKLQSVLTEVNSGTVPRDPASHPVYSVLTDSAWELLNLSSANTSARKRKADEDLEQLAQENFTNLQSERNTVISYWDEKTRLASKKFKAFRSVQTPVLKQIEQILSDRERLLRRTQVNRDGQDTVNEQEEMFDDNDFYQRLLRNLIESKSSDDSAMMASSSEQWLHLHRGRVKKKKDVDTRASKGRKIRYNVHSKLVNFMTPRDSCTWSEEARNQLFHNLFILPDTAGLVV